MRIVIDIMIGLMLIAVVSGGLYIYNSRAERARQTQTVIDALQRLQEQATYHTTVQSAVAGRDVLLVHLHEAWFGEDVPRNVLLDGDRPWIDLAPPGDLGEHPPDPVATRLDQAGFWYNPTTGTFRARVRPAASEALTLDLYNAINGTAMPEFDPIPDTTRRPLAHTPGQTPARQYASMANQTWSKSKDRRDRLATDQIANDSVQMPDSDLPTTALIAPNTTLKTEKPRLINQVNDPIWKESDSPSDVENKALSSVGADSGDEKRPTLQGLEK